MSGQCTKQFAEAKQQEIVLDEGVLEGHLRNWKKQQMSGQCTKQFAEAKQQEIVLEEGVLEGHLRNF